MAIFNFIGSIFGYVLKFFFDITANYGISIALFTIFVKVVLFPFSIKQQQTQAKTARLTAKQNEIKARYGNDKDKYNEELQKLYAKEGGSPTGGCGTMLLQMPILFGLIYAVINPLRNVLHIAPATVDTAISFFNTIPGMTIKTTYPEIAVLNYFERLKNYLPFSGSEGEAIVNYGKGFNFLGLNLFENPTWTSILILIPILCFVTSAGSTILSQKINGTNQTQGGGMTIMMVGMSLLSAWFSFSVPAAVGLYWILSNVFGFLQTCILHYFYNAQTLNAKAEAQRVALRNIEEKKIISAAGDYQPYILPLGSYKAPLSESKKENNVKKVNKKKK